MPERQKPIKFQFDVYVDGSANPNPGRGGWGYWIKTPFETTEGGGHETHATNNQMELHAAIEALKRIRKFSGNVRIFTDSAYLKNGITSWIRGWRRNAWKKDGNPILNRKTWEELESFVNERIKNGFKVEWHHVRSHNGIPGNERADAIAYAYSRDEPVHLDESELVLST